MLRKILLVVITLLMSFAFPALSAVNSQVWPWSPDRPDLIVEDISVTPELVWSNAVNTFVVRIKNRGDVAVTKPGLIFDPFNDCQSEQWLPRECSYYIVQLEICQDLQVAFYFDPPQ